MRKRAEFLIREIVDGIGETGVRCGLIGEMGCSSPLTDNEKKSLKAAALAQKRTGIIIMTRVFTQIPCHITIAFSYTEKKFKNGLIKDIFVHDSC